MSSGNRPPRIERAVMNLRRATSLIAYWSDGAFQLHNYLTNSRSTASPGIVLLLQELAGYHPLAEVIEAFGDSVTRELIDRDVLVEQGSPLDAKESLLAQTWEWGIEARHFHYVTQAVRFENKPALERELLKPQSESRPEPFKDGGGSAVELPLTFDSRVGDLWEALRSRRTRRSFLRAPISLDELSTILQWTWGRRETFQDADLGMFLFKTSPSGGARHPIEVYPVVLRVDGVESGLYHYSVKRHALERLGDQPAESELVRLCGSQEWIADASVVFFMTAMAKRSMWKYPNAHAYRVMLLDAGHLGQTFHLVCTQMGLAPFTTAAIQGFDVEDLLAVDGVGELAVYAAAVGKSSADGGGSLPDTDIRPSPPG
jgi:SagB-type dehydrogenase family enzyme